MAKQDIDSELYKATETMSAELYRASEKNFDLANETSSKLSGQLFALSTLVITVIFGLVQAEKLSIDWLTVLSLITSLASIICGLNRLAVDTNFLIKEGRNKYKGSADIVKQFFDGKAQSELIETFNKHSGSGDTNKRANNYFKWQKWLFVSSLFLLVISITIKS